MAKKKRVTLTPVLFTWLIAGLGAAVAWHIYANARIFAVIAVAVLAATAIVWLGQKYRLHLVVRLLLVAAAYLVGATLITLPAMTDARYVLEHGLNVAVAPVTGWKDLLTLELPLGNYQATQAPIFLVYIVATFTALTLAYGARRGRAVAPIAALAMPFAGLVLGSSEIHMYTQIAVGAAAMLLGLCWLIWLSSSTRRASLEEGGARTGTHTGTVIQRSAVLGRVAGGAVVLAVALGAAVVSVPALAAGEVRDVPRSHVQPVRDIERFVSPLSTFREYRSDAMLDTDLFHVVAPQEVTRLRLATLDTYDGVTMRTSSVLTEQGDTEYRRVASTLPHRAGDPASVVVTMESYDEVWVPLSGDLVSIDFSGRRGPGLTDAFFYQDASATGVQLSQQGFSQGDRYVARVIPLIERTVAGFQPSRAEASLDASLIPASLTEWLSAQNVQNTWQGLNTAIDRLRERGYLSHAIVRGEGETRWMSEYGVSSFEPSRAGHSTARIARLFADLNTRAAAQREDASDADLVAAIGDDEQFAVAAALIADSLGFDARVALGVTLQPIKGAEVPHCEAGACSGKHVTAWLEVRDAATGEWAALDVTPQHRNIPQPEVSLTSEPQHATEVEPLRSDTVAPPESTPGEGASMLPEREESSSLWALIWPYARVVVIAVLSLLLILTPWLTITVLKRRQRRHRMRLTNPNDRVLGAWDEYVDRAIDLGAPAGLHRTRQEFSAGVTGHEAVGVQLAEVADQAAFSRERLTANEAARFWAVVHEETRAMARERTRWQRLRAAWSLRSIRAMIAWEVRVADTRREQASGKPRGVDISSGLRQIRQNVESQGREGGSKS